MYYAGFYILTPMYQDFNEADILEDALQRLSPDLLATLLKDHTRSTPDATRNIFWATDDYLELGAGYGYNDPILPELITGERGHVVMPRVKKRKEWQIARSRGMAEVFTPSWICNAQNNLIDDAWFGRKGVFNEEVTLPDGTHSWRTNTMPVAFPEGKTWRDYVNSNRLEITCGEAPYIVSRYDTTTGDFIPLSERIGLLDRKLRVISENVHESGKWLRAAQSAYRHTYAYEWQGDSLLLAREAMLVSFIEYYRAKFGKMPLTKSLKFIAYVISWNVWQMDGLKYCIPGEEPREPSLFDETSNLCRIKDWGATDPKTKRKGTTLTFQELFKKR